VLFFTERHVGQCLCEVLSGLRLVVERRATGDVGACEGSVGGWRSVWCGRCRGYRIDVVVFLSVVTLIGVVAEVLVFCSCVETFVLNIVEAIMFSMVVTLFNAEAELPVTLEPVRGALVDKGASGADVIMATVDINKAAIALVGPLVVSEFTVLVTTTAVVCADSEVELCTGVSSEYGVV
jgi:hypothetical protein